MSAIFPRSSNPEFLLCDCELWAFSASFAHVVTLWERCQLFQSGTRVADSSYEWVPKCGSPWFFRVTLVCNSELQAPSKIFWIWNFQGETWQLGVTNSWMIWVNMEVWEQSQMNVSLSLRHYRNQVVGIRGAGVQHKCSGCQVIKLVSNLRLVVILKREIYLRGQNLKNKAVNPDGKGSWVYSILLYG